MNAPAQALPQQLRDLVLSVLTPEDIDSFTDMMGRVKAALPAHTMADLQQLAAASLGLPLPDADADIDVNDAATGAALAAASLGTTDDEDDANACYAPAPGYDALDPEEALKQVASWVDDGQPDKSWDDVNVIIDAPSGRRLNIVIIKQPCSVGAMLAGTTDASYHITDGRISYDFTAADIERWRNRRRVPYPVQGTPVGTLLGGAGQLSTGQLGSYTQLGSYSGNPFSTDEWRPRNQTIGDRADVISGYNPDKLRLEREKLQQLEEVRRRNNFDRDRNRRSLKRIRKPQPNPLTGVPDLLPAEVADVQLNLETAQDLTDVAGQDAALAAVDPVLIDPSLIDLPLLVPGDLILPPAASPPCPIYIPTVPANDLATVSDLLAEAWRTYEFCISTCFVGDSRCAYLLDEVTQQVARHNYSYATQADMLHSRGLLVQVLAEVHAITSTAHLPTGAVGQVTVPRGGSILIPAPMPAPILLPTPSPGLTAGSTGFNTNTIGKFTIPNNSSTSPTVYTPTFGDDDKSYDRTFKLLPGHVYRLDDGSSIEVDAVGNYTIHDADAKITYRSSRMREFNRYVNGSDLLGEFIESLGALGASQKQAAAAPIEMFIRWLIFKAAEHDREEPPADVPPLSADDLKDAAADDAPDEESADAIDIVAMAERRHALRHPEPVPV